MAGAINGTVVVVNNATGVVVGQGDFTHTYDGKLIEVTTKDSGDGTDYMEGENSGKQHIFSGEFIYNGETQFRNTRADVFSVTARQYTLVYVSDSEIDESFTGDFFPTDLNDLVPQGGSMKTTIAFKSNSVVSRVQCTAPNTANTTMYWSMDNSLIGGNRVYSDVSSPAELEGITGGGANASGGGGGYPYYAMTRTSNDGIQVNDAYQYPLLTQPPQPSVSMWFMTNESVPTSGTGDMTLMAYSGHYLYEKSWRISMDEVTGKLEFFVSRDSYVVARSIAAINDGIWRHLFCVVNANSIDMYLDGVLQDSVASTGNVNYEADDLGITGTIMYLGSRALEGNYNTDHTTYRWGGGMSRVRLWDTAPIVNGSINEVCGQFIADGGSL